jgi:hypothetical protein
MADQRTLISSLYYKKGRNPQTIDNDNINDVLNRSIISNEKLSFKRHNSILKFNLSKAGNVFVDVYNLHGNKVAALFDGSLPIGDHEIIGDYNNLNLITSGVYFLRIRSSTDDKTIRLPVIR